LCIRMPLRPLLVLCCSSAGFALLSGAGMPLRSPAARLHRSVPPRVAAAVQPAIDPATLAPEDKWVSTLDYDAFKQDCQELGDRLGREQGPADIAHLKKMIGWSNACAAVGLLTMWMRPNLLTIAALSTWICTRWTMIAHHTCHGGYNKQDDGSGRFTSMGFALGSTLRRARDWFDWMLPEAWNVEHNNLHHFRLGEPGDPDLVERNLEMLRDMKLPRAVKYVVVGFLAAVWKWYYYAPNTYKQLKIQQLKKEGITVPIEEAHAAFTLPSFINVGEAKKFGFGFRDYMRRVMGPYLALRFFALPAPLLFFGPGLYRNAVLNMVLADVLSNIHSFIIIATNHCGKDLYRFEESVMPKSGSFYLRAVTSSANFPTGKADTFLGNLNDFFHGWLNYQIEHHAWPQLSMLSYQKAAPQLKAICEKHGVPYVQENVFVRLKKTADIMVGATSMRPYEPAWENPNDEFRWK